jgi:hypothetical protein
VEEKEPGYWVRWAAGIAATVVGGVLVAVLAGAFKDGPPDLPPTPTPTPTPTPSARVRITQFSLASRSVGEYPEATFKVYNAGEDTADRCHLEWHPLSTILGDHEAEFSDEFAGEAQFSDEFAVEPKMSYTLKLRGSTQYSAGLKVSAAKVECSNAKSEAETKSLIVPQT